MQRAIVEAVASRAASDADHSAVSQLLLKDRQQGLAVLLLERAQGVVQKDPARPVQQQAGKCEALLLLQRKFLVPALLMIERGDEMAKPDPLERGHYGGVVEASGRRRIAGAGAQRAERQGGSRRHAHHAVTRGQVDRPVAPRPQTRDRAEQGAPAI
jgi:hypothetical protein